MESFPPAYTPGGMGWEEEGERGVMAEFRALLQMAFGGREVSSGCADSTVCTATAFPAITESRLSLGIG